MPSQSSSGTAEARTAMAFARPGDVLRFECHDCEEIYRQTVQPRRNVSRALQRLEEGNTARAHELLTEALDDLVRIADYMNERARRNA